MRTILSLAAGPAIMGRVTTPLNRLAWMIPSAELPQKKQSGKFSSDFFPEAG